MSSLTRFIIGSSFISGAISFLYIGSGMSNWRKSNWSHNQFNSFELLMAFVLILLGLFNVIIHLIHENLDIPFSEQISMFIGGALYGLTLSLIGRQFGFPIKVFKFNKNNQYLIHIIAAILYSLIFGIIIHNLNQLV